MKIVNEADIVKVKYRHYRVVSDNVEGLPKDFMLSPTLITMSQYDSNYDKLNPRGGLTVAEVILKDGTTKFGVAACSLNDNFRKSMGRVRAYGRAISGKKVPVDNTLTEKVALPEFVQDILKD